MDDLHRLEIYLFVRYLGMVRTDTLDSQAVQVVIDGASERGGWDGRTPKH